MDAGLSQPGQDRLVQRRGAFPAVHDEQHQVGFFRRGARLARGGAGQPSVVLGQSAGIADGERMPFVEPADAVVAVAGDARLVMHQGVTRSREPVEQRRFADVRPSDQGDQGSAFSS
jgi:hypothetical protein